MRGIRHWVTSAAPRQRRRGGRRTAPVRAAGAPDAAADRRGAAGWDGGRFHESAGRGRELP